MPSTYLERPSASPFVQNYAWGRTDDPGQTTHYPDGAWYMLLTRSQGRTRLAVGGPALCRWQQPHAAGTEWLGLRLALGAFLAPFPAQPFLNTLVELPGAGPTTFWLYSAAWEFPTLENVDTFVERLVRAEVLRPEPVVAAVLRDQPPALAACTVRRRFQRATGLTPGQLHQVERVRHAARLLQQGVSILDTVAAAGYYDQPHLTRAMRRFLGQTPAHLAQPPAPA